ncbi:MAG: hypothetical protein Kow0068_18440 [Marinilabiliales bacterium]
MCRLSVFFIVVLFIVSCAEDEYYLYEKENFSISIPKNMEYVENSLEKTFACFKISDENDPSGLKISVYRDLKHQGERDFELNDYYKFVADNILDKTLVSGSLNPPIKTTINEKNAMTFEITGKYKYEDELYDMFLKSVIIETDKYFYEITFSLEKKYKDMYIDKINEIASSIKITGK